jgi:hypothetical protein
MKDFLIPIVCLGLAGLAWLMLVVSDRLLRDRDEQAPRGPALREARSKDDESAHTCHRAIGSHG